ncbi:MAG: class I SAM-dependent methyltransferase [Heliobacteriaceae bacterium]|nr:class I SAM-dependent methyltransferase [Heliobacteriaceae bacterium]MDD4587283.1 class I SAM-dependent methyltransferase [Heliobacteriaceae bacterium]
MNSMNSAVSWAQKMLAEVISPGSFVIDATAGNGNDTLFLANRVLPSGLVWAVDIQPAAIAATEGRLRQANIKRIRKVVNGSVDETCLVGDEVILLQRDHGDLGPLMALTNRLRPALAAAVLNLGYLPGGDHSVITGSVSTICALNTLAAELTGGGRLVVVVYTGHPGASAEVRAVSGWWQALPPQNWDAVSIGFPNRSSSPPVVFVAEKKLSGRRRVPLA